MKFNYYLTCLLILFFASEIMDYNIAQSQTVSKTYNGYIDGKYEIKMTLTQNDTELSGSYFYTKIGTPLKLKGTIDNLNKFSLNEFNFEGSITGVFVGTINNSQITGNWSKPDGSKSMTFILNEITNNKPSVSITNSDFTKFLSNFKTLQLPIIEGFSCGEKLIEENYIKKFIPQDETLLGYPDSYCGKLKIDSNYLAIFVTTQMGIEYDVTMYLYDKNGTYHDKLEVEYYGQTRGLDTINGSYLLEYGFKSTISKDFKIKLEYYGESDEINNYVIKNGKILKL